MRRSSIVPGDPPPAGVVTAPGSLAACGIRRTYTAPRLKGVFRRRVFVTSTVTKKRRPPPPPRRCRVYRTCRRLQEEHTMGSKLLTNGYVVTVDGERAVHPNGFVHVEGERISAVGPMSDLGGRTADETIDLHGMLAMPGLINLHNHHWASLFKNTGEGLLLEAWLDEVTIPLLLQLTNETLRVASYFGAIEMLRTGTTCSLNHIVNVNDEESFAAICEPLPEVGIRQLVTKEIRQTPDPPFSDAYPAYPHVRSLDEELDLAARCVERWDGHGGLVHAGLVVETGAIWMMHNATSEEAI